MKQITIITRREKLEVVQEILQKKYACGLTVKSVEGCGNQEGFGDYEGVRVYGEKSVDISLVSKTQIDTVVKDQDKDAIIEELCEKLRTGKFGDGKIFVKDVEEAIRIRTGERGEEALDTVYRHQVK